VRDAPRSRPASSCTPFASTATTTADAFRNRFGGECVTYASDKPKPRASKTRTGERSGVSPAGAAAMLIRKLADALPRLRLKAHASSTRPGRRCVSPAAGRRSPPCRGWRVSDWPAEANIAPLWVIERQSTINSSITDLSYPLMRILIPVQRCSPTIQKSRTSRQVVAFSIDRTFP
jgi:hypothetical protein